MRALLVGLLVCTVARADIANNEHAPEVRALVDAWRKAQNDGDFAAYQALYAARFTGVRRSGPRTLRFDRAGWMRDRQRMFGKKMSVDVDKLAVASAGSTARATFVQSFAQGSYRDSGEKQLVLVREGGALRIAQEEMLASRVAAPAASPIDAFAWIVDGGVQLTDNPDPAWGKGKRSLEVGQPTVVRQPVGANALPPEWAAWKGRTVRTFDEHGTACEAKVTGFALVGRVIPHFGTVQEWRDKAEKDAVEEAWQLATKSLIAVIDGCSGARWARAGSLPTPTIVDGQAPDAALAALATPCLSNRPPPRPKYLRTRGQEPTPPGLVNAPAFISLAMIVVIAIIVWKKVPGAIGRALDGKIAVIRDQLAEAESAAQGSRGAEGRI